MLALGLLLAQAPEGARYVEGMSRALDQVIGTLRGAPGMRAAGSGTGEALHHPLVFSVNLTFAHRAYVKQCSTDLLMSYVDGLKEAGAKRVDINPGLWPWNRHDQENIAKYDALVRHIRELGLQLAWNPSYCSRSASVVTRASSGQ